MSFDPSKSRELARIQWRQSLLSDPVGRAWLTARVSQKKRPRERDLDPQCFVPGFTDRSTP